MMKEIEEQPKAIRDTISPRIKDGKIVLDDISLTEEDIKNINKIYIVACGSAYHVGVVGKYVIEKMCRIGGSPARLSAVPSCAAPRQSAVRSARCAFFGCP